MIPENPRKSVALPSPLIELPSAASTRVGWRPLAAKLPLRFLFWMIARQHLYCSLARFIGKIWEKSHYGEMCIFKYILQFSAFLVFLPFQDVPIFQITIPEIPRKSVALPSPMIMLLPAASTRGWAGGWPLTYCWGIRHGPWQDGIYISEEKKGGLDFWVLVGAGFSTIYGRYCVQKPCIWRASFHYACTVSLKSHAPQPLRVRCRFASQWKYWNQMIQ